jgi:hypothetical protein
MDRIRHEARFVTLSGASHPIAFSSTPARRFNTGGFCMSNPLRSLGQLLWEFKWWWLTPLMLMVVMFGLLMYWANRTGQNPFNYALF